MKKTGIILLMLGVLLTISCSQRGPLFEKYQKFENNTWDRFNQVIFNVPFEKGESEYNIFLVVKPVNGFEYDKMPVYIIMNTPSGEERMKEVSIQVKEGDKFIGETEGEPVVIKTLLWKAIKISDKGNCRISIENMIPKIQTSGIAELGVLIEKTK